MAEELPGFTRRPRTGPEPKTNGAEEPPEMAPWTATDAAEPPEEWAEELQADALALDIGDRTAADLKHGAPPPQLIGEFLTPEGPTVIYGPGGTGKGVASSWLILLLVRAGHVVMVVDYEGHEREWGSRLRGLGATEWELGRVHYRAPFGPDWRAPTGSLAEVADAIRTDAERLAVSYVVVDSYSVATSSGDTLGGLAAAREYFTALTRIGLPSLTLAHVTGSAERWPAKPFGSVFVHNLARETWAVEKLGGEPEEEEQDPEVPPTLELEFRNRKANDRRQARPQFLTLEFFADGSIVAKAERLAGASLVERIDAVLVEPMNIKKIVAAIKEDTGEVYRERTVLASLKRHPDRFTANDERPKLWSRRP